MSLLQILGQLRAAQLDKAATGELVIFSDPIGR